MVICEACAYVRPKRCSQKNEQKHNGRKDVVIHVETVSFDSAGQVIQVELPWQSCWRWQDWARNALCGIRRPGLGGE